MAQLSRPYQIALAALVVLAAAWFILLRPHSSSSESSSSSAPASSPSTASASHSSAPSGANPAAPSSVYHGSAPGVEGLTKAVAKAHEAVATSQRSAKQLEERSAQASSTGTPSGAGASASAPAAGTAAATAAAPKTSSSTHTSASSSVKNQALVEGELKQGKVVVLLFWNPKGADDVLVHRELQLLVHLHHSAAKAKAEEVRHADRFFGLELDKTIAVHEGPASSVASFGSITRGVQVYSTPTIVIVNPKGQASTLTGFADAYTIEQAIEEDRHA
jgi:hypothetical protein